MTVTPQLINIGTTANDGTGDRPRPMAIKYNQTVKALADAINLGITSATIVNGHLVVTRTDGTATDIGAIGGSDTQPSATLPGLPTVDPASTTLLTASDPAGNLGPLSLASLLSWIVGQGAIPATDSQPSATLPTLPTVVAAAATLLTASDPAGNLGPLSLASLLAWIISQAPDITASPTVSSVANSDLVLMVRNGAVVLAPQPLFVSTSGGNGSSTGGSTTPAAATTLSVSVNPASVTVGQTIALVVAPGSGGWPSGVVVSPIAVGLQGTFDQASKVGVGTNSIFFVFTVTAVGSGTLSASAPNMVLTGTAAAVTGTAAQSTGNTGGTGIVPLTMVNDTYADRGDGTGKKMLTGGSGTRMFTLPSNGQWLAKVQMRGGPGPEDYGDPKSVLMIGDGSSNFCALGLFSNNFVVLAAGGRSGGSDSPALNDGAIHTLTLECVPGQGSGPNAQGGFNGYLDGVLCGSRGGNYGIAIAGSNPITITGGTSARLSAGLFDLRIYDGTLAAPGNLLGEWLLDGTGASL